VTPVITSRWWVLLVLAAFFSMHGVQCTAADCGAEGSTTAGAVAMAALGNDHAEATPRAADAAAPGAVAHSATSVAVPADVHATGHSGHSSGSMAHLWATCLAVLSATLAALAVAPTTVAVTSFAAAGRRSTPRWVQRPAPLRAPDIFSLCVLRT
jgi:hypothetical protein